MYKDYHLHTEFSDDSVYPMEEVVKDAIVLGIDELCFTDHVDYGVHPDYHDESAKIVNGKKIANVDYPVYVQTINKLSEKYKGQIVLKKGLEFGIQQHTIPFYEKLFSRYAWDFIILSIHQIKDEEFWLYEYQEGKSQHEYNIGYYQELLDVIRKYKNYSVLGHLDLIRRYDKAGEYDFEPTREIVTEILKQVISDGKGIEINTSSYRYGLKDLMPSRDVLKLYKELGGSIITIGSDSHKHEHLGAYIKEVKEILKELGYTQYCSYEKMKPIFHTI
jgi:histidinol-phosphatase (PHP family)